MHVNSNYVGCPLKVNGIKFQRGKINKANIVDSFKTGSESLNVI